MFQYIHLSIVLFIISFSQGHVVFCNNVILLFVGHPSVIMGRVAYVTLLYMDPINKSPVSKMPDVIPATACYKQNMMILYQLQYATS